MGKSKDLATLKDSGLSIDGTLTTTSTGTNLTSNSYNVVKIQTDKDDNGSNDDAILQFTNGSSNTVKGELRYDESESMFEIGHGDNQGHIRVDSSGRVLKPNTPAFRAYGLGNTASAGGTANSGEYLLVGSNGVPVNNGSHYNASNGTFTVPVAGLYYFAFSLLYDNSYSNNGSASLRKNGSDLYEYAYVEGDQSADYIQASASGVVSCAANDAIRLYSYLAGWHTASESSFTGFLIG